MRHFAVMAIFMAFLAGSVGARAAAAKVAPAIDLATAVKEFQLQESSRPIRDTMRNWTPPRKMVVVVDEPGRTAWLQQAMPKGVTVIGIPSVAAAGPQLPTPMRWCTSAVTPGPLPTRRE